MELDAEKFRLSIGFDAKFTASERRRNSLCLCRHLERLSIVIVWQVRVRRRTEELRLTDMMVHIEAEGQKYAHYEKNCAATT